jgi:hypothetical protein
MDERGHDGARPYEIQRSARIRAATAGPEKRNGESMNVPVKRARFESRMRAWVEEDEEANLEKLRTYLEKNWPEKSAGFAEAELDLMCECLWTLAHSKSRLWAEEGLDELMKEIRETRGKKD